MMSVEGPYGGSAAGWGRAVGKGRLFSCRQWGCKKWAMVVRVVACRLLAPKGRWEGGWCGQLQKGLHSDAVGVL